MQPPPASDRPNMDAMPVVTLDFQTAHSANEVDTFVPSIEQCCAWVAEVLARHHISAAELTIRSVDTEESQLLNATYRGQNKPTNVLSFPFDTDIPLPIRLLGDLVICVPVIATEAAQQGKSVIDHWAHLIVHGTLHLLGYDHIDEEEADQMERLEIEILAQFDIADPYHKERSTSHE